MEALRAGAIAGASAWAFSNAVEWAGATASAPGEGLIRVSQNTWATAEQFRRLVMIHGAIGGVSSVLQGGKFGHGFASAGVTKLLSPSIGNIKAGRIGNISVVQTFTAAALGGSVSKATGGKFANGAITAAYRNLFNQQGEVDRRKKMSVIKESVADYRELISTVMSDLDSGGDPRSVSLIIEGFNGETQDAAFTALLKVDQKLAQIQFQLMNESGAAFIDSVTKNIVKSAGGKLSKPQTTGGGRN